MDEIKISRGSITGIYSRKKRERNKKTNITLQYLFLKNGEIVKCDEIIQNGNDVTIKYNKEYRVIKGEDVLRTIRDDSFLDKVFIFRNDPGIFKCFIVDEDEKGRFYY